MLRSILALAAALFLIAPAAARVVEKREYGNWTYEYNVSANVTSCIASRYYTNAQFSVRLYGDRMDVVFYRDDFRFRWDTDLGTTTVTVSGNRYRLEAGTARRGTDNRPTAQTMYLTVRPRDYDRFFADVQRARNLRIDLWDGRAYPVDLTGSRRALDAAWDCWRRRDTGR